MGQYILVMHMLLMLHMVFERFFYQSLMVHQILMHLLHYPHLHIQSALMLYLVYPLVTISYMLVLEVMAFQVMPTMRRYYSRML